MQKLEKSGDICVNRVGERTLVASLVNYIIILLFFGFNGSISLFFFVLRYFQSKLFSPNVRSREIIRMYRNG